MGINIEDARNAMECINFLNKIVKTDNEKESLKKIYNALYKNIEHLDDLVQVNSILTNLLGNLQNYSENNYYKELATILNRI